MRTCPCSVANQGKDNTGWHITQGFAYPTHHLLDNKPKIRLPTVRENGGALDGGKMGPLLGVRRRRARILTEANCHLVKGIISGGHRHLR